MKNVYPVILEKKEDGYLVDIPDFKLQTKADDLFGSIVLARSIISTVLIKKEDKGEELNEASKELKIPEEYTHAFITYIDIDTYKYRIENNLAILAYELDFNEELMKENGVDPQEWWEALDHDFAEYGFEKGDKGYYVALDSEEMFEGWSDMFIYLTMNDLFKKYVTRFYTINPEDGRVDSYATMKEMGMLG